MTNLDYLENQKMARETRFSSSKLSTRDVELRKMNALEIIAEELCKLNELLIKVKNTGLKIKK